MLTKNLTIWRNDYEKIPNYFGRDKHDIEIQEIKAAIKRLTINYF